MYMHDAHWLSITQCFDIANILLRDGYGLGKPLEFVELSYPSKAGLISTLGLDVKAKPIHVTLKHGHNPNHKININHYFITVFLCVLKHDT